jgi:hypothetical protein
MRRTTRLLYLFSLLAPACLISGCEPPPPSREELGRIVFSESEVPGADDTYQLPEHLRKAQEEAQKNQSEDQRRLPGM